MPRFAYLPFGAGPQVPVGATFALTEATLALSRIVNGQTFCANVADVLSPPLQPSDTIVVDNLGSHKGPAVRAVVEAAGARLLFLPPHSPDFDPIEMASAKLKALLRKAAERTVEGLWAAIGRLIDTVTPDECANFFAAAGYEPNQIENALVSRKAGPMRR